MDEARLFRSFERLVDLDPDTRETELRNLGDEDPELAQRLRRMLSLEQGADEVFERPLVRNEWERLQTAARIGRYVLLEEIGRGGAGRVFCARQQKPDRLVALKILKDPYSSEVHERRFLQEIELLGRLDHPRICAIYDAGVDELLDAENRPLGARLWFAMELVEGQTITRHAKEQGLDLEARIRLLIQVADAMQHAHQRGVLHRDLKPANVLVNLNETVTSETGGSTSVERIKVLDFGIGRLEAEGALEQSSLTLEGARLGTLAYMSPEQISGRNEDVDTRSDIWSLGVMAYELLTGQMPFPMTGQSFLEMEKQIHESRPRPMRYLTPGLDQDLETIITKALQVEKEQRYATIGAMGDDLQRFLAGETILARPATAWYQVRKFAGRNRGLVAGLSLALLLLVSGSILVLVLAIEADRERVRAQKAELGMHQLNKLVEEELIAAVSPARALGKTPTIQKLLKGLEERLDQELGGYPLTRARLLRTLGRTRSGLGELAAAESSLRAALAIQVERLGELHAETLSTRAALGTVLNLRGKLDEATRFREQSVALAQRSLAPGDELRLGLLGDLAHQYSIVGRREQAEELLRRVVRLRQEHLGPEHMETLIAKNNLAQHLSKSGKVEEARAIDARLLATRRRVLGEDHPHTASSLSNLALDLYRLKRYEEGLPLAKAAWARMKELYGDDHISTFNALNNVCLFYRNLEQVEMAKATLAGAIPKALASLGADHPVTIRFMSNQADHCLKLGEAAEALELAERAIEGAKKTFGEKHWTMAIHLLRSADALKALGKLEEAWVQASKAFDVFLQSLGSKHVRKTSALRFCTDLAQDLGDPARAAALVKKAESASAH